MSEIANKTPSLYWRLISRVSGLILLMLTIVIAGLFISLVTTIDTLRDRGLHSQAADVAAYLKQGEDGAPVLDLPEGLEQSYKSSDSQYLYLVFGEDGHILFSSEERSEVLNKARDPLFKYYDGGQDRDFYGATVDKEIGGATYYIQVAQGPKHDDVLIDTLFEEMFETGAWFLLTFVVGLIVIISVTVRTTLKPVLRASGQAGQISPRSTGSRISERNLPREILPLVQSMNAALDRLEEGFRQQREFTANAAHQLRTPLAVLRANIENLDIDDAEAEKTLGATIERMNRMVSQLLKVAQLESLELDAGNTADLHDVAVEVATSLAPLGIDHDKTIEVKGEAENPVRGSREAILHAVRNLVENALDHTPEGTAVVIDVQTPGAISVRDAGAGIPEEYRDQIFRRFWRSPERANRPGAGLGLPIAATIMEMHGGEISAENGEEGGAVFTLSFPENL